MICQKIVTGCPVPLFSQVLLRAIDCLLNFPPILLGLRLHLLQKVFLFPRKFDSCLNISEDALELLARLTAEEQSRPLLLYQFAHTLKSVGSCQSHLADWELADCV